MSKNGVLNSRAASSAASRDHYSRLLGYVSVPAGLWVMLWLNYNSGPGVLRSTPTNLLDWGHYLRTLFPFVILGAPLLLVRMNSRLPPFSGPLALWLTYGVIALLASASSPFPEDATFWGATYLAAFAGLMVFVTGSQPLERARQLNHLSWLLTTGILVLLVFVAREHLFETGSAYGVHQAAEEVAGASMSRSSGMARFAAVPGVIGFTLMLGSLGMIRRVLGFLVFLPSAYLIYLLQSRGAMFGFAFSVAVVMFYFSIRTRTVGVVLGIFCAVIIAVDLLPGDYLDRLILHVTRGQSAEQFQSMTGRTRPWQAAWDQSVVSPIWGFGHMSDRYLIGEHVHNSYLYALLAGGVVGAGLFIAGLAWTWRLFFNAMKISQRLPGDHHLTLVQVGGILAFFTVRSLPEVSGAHYSVDTMILLPAIAYLTVLVQVTRQVPRARLTVERLDRRGKPISSSPSSVPTSFTPNVAQ